MHAGLLVSACNSYDLCHPWLTHSHTDRQLLSGYIISAGSSRAKNERIRENSRWQGHGHQCHGSSVSSNETCADTSSEIINVNTINEL